MNILQDAAPSPAQMRQKKARLADGLNRKILRRPGPLDLLEKNILPLNSGVKQALEAGCGRLPEDSDPFPDEEESSRSNSASPEIPGECQAQGALGAGLQSGTRQRPGPFQRGTKSPRQKRPKDSKPKVRKLKYHQYIPPDQKTHRSPMPMDAAYSRLLQQQQIFLQLQILNQQQHPFSFQTIRPGNPGLPPEQIISFASASPAQVPGIPLSPLTKSVQRAANASCLKPELLPANLDDLTVSELRQQLRKRRLPVSGTKPALLDRLKPYQIFSPRPAPAAQMSSFENLEPKMEDASLVEKERVIERLTWRLEEEQRQADGLREELEHRKRQPHRRPLLGEEPEAPAPLGELLPLSPSEDPYPLSGPLDSANPLESPVIAGRQRHSGDGRFSGLLVPRPVELDFPYSPSSLQSFFTLDDTEVETRNESSSDENLDSEVYLCGSLGSEAGVYRSLEALNCSDSGGFHSLEHELTEAIKSAELSPNQSIEDILEEHLMTSDSSPSLEQCFPESPTESLSSSPGYVRELRERSDGAAAVREGSDVFEEAPSLPGPLSPPPGGPGELSPVSFDPADWMEPLPQASPGGIPAEFLDAPDLNINRMIDLLVEQW
ncbi:uncharacterized protein [Scyliorhinus torazame]|uniref:uncharacterized protein isoform X2 n=1 Tax=Scyliorhinus torazame TaxID=75743 RepID=UPI003B5C6F39